MTGQPRLHVVGLPHTSSTPAYSVCAYTQKHRRFLDMMTGYGYEVASYGGPENTGACVEHVVCSDPKVPDPGFIPVFSANEPLFQRFNDRAIAALRDRVEPHDVICLIAGLAQQPIRDAFTSHLVVEYGIGYGGVIPNTHHVFESYSWMHTVLGSLTGGDAHAANGRFFDAVIPNYYDPTEFPAGSGDGEYLLFVGRLIERKGIQIAIDTAQHTGLPLIVGGGGDYPLPDWVDYRGLIGPEERAELMGGARAIMAPTLYLEPFGGVNAEARLCGTPVISTDFGAFPENVEQEVDGYRCHTLTEFIDAAMNARHLDRDQIRERALSKYSLDAVAPQYAAYFDRLRTLWGAGFYQLTPVAA